MATTARLRPESAEDIGARLDAVEAKIDEILALLRERRSAAPDDRFGRLLAALDASMDGRDLPFTAAEVLEHASVDYGLGEALRACGISTADKLGAVFRTLRDREIAGLRLVRRGRLWELART